MKLYNPQRINLWQIIFVTSQNRSYQFVISQNNSYHIFDKIRHTEANGVVHSLTYPLFNSLKDNICCVHLWHTDALNRWQKIIVLIIVDTSLAKGKKPKGCTSLACPLFKSVWVYLKQFNTCASWLVCVHLSKRLLFVPLLRTRRLTIVLPIDYLENDNWENSPHKISVRNEKLNIPLSDNTIYADLPDLVPMNNSDDEHLENEIEVVDWII